ncbi:hypothetical protein CHUAL_005192 [Chamberlinius hualienensis]
MTKTPSTEAIMMDETALDVLTRAATLVETDAAKHLAQGEDKATVHPVDFSSAIDHRNNNNNSDINGHYELLPTAGLRLKRRQQERRSTESKVKRCFTEDLQKVNCYSETKENVSVCDYMSEGDDDQHLSDEDTGKLVVDDKVDEEKDDSDREIMDDCGDETKSSTQRDERHCRRVNNADSDVEGKEDRVQVEDKCMDRQVDRRMKENDEDEEVEDDEQTTIDEVEEQEGPLDMTTNNRSRNQNNYQPRWSLSSSTSSSSPPAAVNMSSIYYSHPPRYNPYVSSAPPPPYHPLPHHHLSRPHSASPPPYQPPSYATGNHYSDAPTTNSTTNGHRNISSLRPAHSVQQHRPSVITCASTSTNKTPPPQSTPVPPPTHHHHHHRQTVLNSNSGNHHYHQTQHHRSCPPIVGSPDGIDTGNVGVISRRTLSDPTASRTHLTSSSTNSNGGHSKSRRSSEHARYGHRREILSGMCDPVIDEHFRRSLGKHYTEYLSSSSTASNKTPPVNNKNSSESGNTGINSNSSTSSISITGMSVDDHFAKALGETWLRLQNKGLNSSSSSTASNSPTSKPSSPATSVASTYASSSASPKSVSPSPAVQSSQQRQSIVST